MSGGIQAAVLPTPTHHWPAPLSPLPALVQTAVTDPQRTTDLQLRHLTPPSRDDVRLAIAYRTLSNPPLLVTPIVTRALPIGTVDVFTIPNTDTLQTSRIQAEIRAVGQHAYFWFDEAIRPDTDELADMVTAFDEMYETAVTLFGSENNPGIDGDPRLHIVHIAPSALCRADCGLAGYFSASNSLSTAVDANSNMREMFVMNAAQLGTDTYLTVLGHELRHMIEDNYDRGDSEWEVEGSAVLAEELLGYPDNAQYRANHFLYHPDQPLLQWSHEDSIPYYGQGYLFNRYLYGRLTPPLYRQFTSHPLPGLMALEAIAVSNNLNTTADDLWLDWQTALAIHNDPNVTTTYQLPGVTVNTVQMTAVDSLHFRDQTTVNQYASDYYQLPITKNQRLSFVGSTHTPLLNALPPSGQMMWLAQRGNYSNPRLTREVDLRSVTAASLHYAVYIDLEAGHDFGYVSVSVDNGRTWQGLTAPHMQGQSPADNPAFTALTPRFYTGRSHQWRNEQIDLSSYTGQTILLRFELTTDLVLAQAGIALDNIAIPEIGFYDDAEALAPGWLAEGFSRTTAYLPQSWHIRLITFGNRGPMVHTYPVDERGQVTLLFRGGILAKRPILIIAANSPTLSEANYQLSVTSNP
jgi:hypothetical protein